MESLPSWGNSAPQPEDAAARSGKLRTFPLSPGRKRLFSAASETLAHGVTEPPLRSARLEAGPAYDSRNAFLTQMRHELMTPLNAVLGFGRLLLQQAASPAQEDCARHVVRGGERLLLLIDELLDATRLSNTAGEPVLEPVAVAEIVRAAVEETRERAAKRKIAISVGSDPARRCLVLTDRQRLHQVLLRLLALAVKLSTEGSGLTCEYHPVGNQVRLCIHDRAPGVPLDGFSRLFPGAGQAGLDTVGFRDAGISLALCKHLVETLHGTFGAESTAGQGSTLWVQLDGAADDGPSPAIEEAAPSTYPGHEPSILYIDDDESNLKLIEYLIAANGAMRLLTATTGMEGVEMASTQLPSLILLDLHLQDLSGEEVLGHLRADPATRNIPVVAVSGETDPAKIKRLKEAGVSSYLSKPLNLPQVQNLLLTMLKRPVPHHSAA